MLSIVQRHLCFYFSSLRLGLPTPQPSRHHHAQSLLCSSFHHPRTHHVLESHRSKPSLSPTVSMSDDMLSALTLPLHCASSFLFLVNSEHASCCLPHASNAAKRADPAQRQRRRLPHLAQRLHRLPPLSVSVLAQLAPHWEGTNCRLRVPFRAHRVISNSEEAGLTELALQLRTVQTAECSSTGQQSSREVTQYEVVECSSVCNTLAQDVNEMIAEGWQLWPMFVANGCIFLR